MVIFVYSALFNATLARNLPGEAKNLSLSLIFFMAQPKLFALSMMWTLNSRRELQAAHNNADPSNFTSQIARELGTRPVSARLFNYDLPLTLALHQV